MVKLDVSLRLLVSAEGGVARALPGLELVLLLMPRVVVDVVLGDVGKHGAADLARATRSLLRALLKDSVKHKG